jgi:hypothetical protein
VYLAVGGGADVTTHYVGNFVLDSGEVGTWTITTAPDVSAPAILDGNQGSSTNCPTAQCNGPILYVGNQATVNMSNITFQNGDNSLSTPDGGAIDSADGEQSTLNISNCAFYNNVTNHYDGGAIDSGDNSGHGTLTIDSSYFSGNSGSDGGAIDSGDDSGHGSLTITRSMFVHNTGELFNATEVGGAIDSGDNGGSGTLSISGTDFSNNDSYFGGAVNVANGTFSATKDSFVNNFATTNGGAINIGSGRATATITTSEFRSNNATDGGAIDVGDQNGHGSLDLSHSSFVSNGAFDGGALDVADNGDGSGSSSASDVGSTYERNAATMTGGAIAVSSNGGVGSLQLAATSLDANSSGGGGALYIGATAAASSIDRSTFSNDTSISDNQGGGAMVDATSAAVTVGNSTFAFDSALGIKGSGGAVTKFGSGDFFVDDSTFIQNSAADGEGSAVWGSVQLRGDILAKSTGEECHGGVDGGYNVSDDASCSLSDPTSVVSSEIQYYLGPLMNNGGPTETVALLAKPTKAITTPNPALGLIPANAKWPGTSVAVCADTDQRGQSRKSPCDPGSFSLDVSSTTLTLSKFTLHRGFEQNGFFNVQVAPTISGVSPAGTVRVFAGATRLCVITLIKGKGSCSLTANALKIGHYAVTASYSGGLNWSASTSTAKKLSVVH